MNQLHQPVIYGLATTFPIEDLPKYNTENYRECKEFAAEDVHDVVQYMLETAYCDPPVGILVMCECGEPRAQVKLDDSPETLWINVGPMVEMLKHSPGPERWFFLLAGALGIALALRWFGP